MKRFFVTALLAAAATLWAGSLAQANILVGGDYHLARAIQRRQRPGGRQHYRRFQYVRHNSDKDRH